MNRTSLATVTGLLLGLTLVFGTFGDMLIVALFGLIGFLAAKVLDGDVDVSTYLARAAATVSEATGAELVQDDDAETPEVGRNELGTVSIADAVVVKLAARAAAEHPDAGAAATRILGRAVPGAGHLGTRSSDLDSLPRTTVDVDGSKAFISLQLSVRWPASVATVTQAVREHVRERVTAMTGLSVDEVHIVVLDLVTDIAPPPRVR